MDSTYAEIYEVAELRTEMQYVADMCALGDLRSVRIGWSRMTDRILSFCRRFSEYDEEQGRRFTETVYRTAEAFSDSSVAQAVLYDEVIPMIELYLSQFKGIDIEDSIWSIKGTTSGYVTLIDNSIGKYAHSLHDPMNEAGVLAERLYDPGVQDFYIFGCGLGYLPYQLWRSSMGSMCVHVYDSQDIISYAELFGPLGKIAPDKLVIKEGSGIDFIISEYSELINGGCLPDHIFVSELFRDHLLPQTQSMPQLNSMIDITRLSAKRNWEINIRCNLANSLGYYDFNDVRQNSDEWIVVAAGPSFDENIDFLLENVGKKNIIAVNHCIPMLEKVGIKPNFFVVEDPYDTILSHVVGHEEYTADITLLADVCSYWGFLDKYRGPKYLLNVFYDGEITESSDLNLPDWHVAGTVTSVAIEAACLMGAKQIYVMGMDLAYPDGKEYGQSSEKNNKVSNSEYVRANDGRNVPTSSSFRMYGDQISDQVMSHDGVRMYNLSSHGMYIQGMRTGKWWENGINVDTDPTVWLDSIRDDDFLRWDEKYFLLRQMTDRAEFIEKHGMDHELAGSVLDIICKEMIAESEELGRIRVHRGTALNVIVISDSSDVDKASEIIKASKVTPDNSLIINTQEKFSGVQVSMDGIIRKETSQIPDESGSVMIFGKKYPYYQIPEPVPSIDFYREVLSFLAERKGVRILSTDQYSLFGALCSGLTV